MFDQIFMIYMGWLEDGSVRLLYRRHIRVKISSAVNCHFMRHFMGSFSLSPAFPLLLWAWHTIRRISHFLHYLYGIVFCLLVFILLSVCRQGLLSLLSPLHCPFGRTWNI